MFLVSEFRSFSLTVHSRTLQSHLKTARFDRKTVFSSPEMILHTKFADVSSLNKREGPWWNRRAKHCRDRTQKLTSNVRSVKHMKIFWRLLFFYFLKSSVNLLLHACFYFLSIIFNQVLTFLLKPVPVHLIPRLNNNFCLFWTLIKIISQPAPSGV